MIRYLAISALAFAIFGACSKKNDDKSVEPATPATAEVVAADTVPASKAASVLVIKAAKLTVELGDNNPDGAESIVLEDNGNVVVGGETVATISADGKVVDKGGKEIASLAADGTLRFADEEQTALVGADGSLTIDGEKVASFGEDNMLMMAELSEKVKFEGPDEAKRAMMVVFMLAMMVGDTEDAPVSEDGSAAAPTEE